MVFLQMVLGKFLNFQVLLSDIYNTNSVRKRNWPKIFFSYDEFRNGYYFNAFDLSTSNKSGIANVVPTVRVGMYINTKFQCSYLKFKIIFSVQTAELQNHSNKPTNNASL